MDLETKGKKYFEALALQGEIATTQTQLLGLQGEIAKADSDIKRSQDAKALSIVARKKAEDGLGDAVDKANIAKQQVAQAKAALKSAELVVEQAERQQRWYSDAFLGQLDKDTQQFELAKQVIEATRDDVLQGLENTRKDLESRRAELKAVGIELNFLTAAPQPKTTIL